jgi:DNA-binding GntR family transcriptional regulator
METAVATEPAFTHLTKSEFAYRELRRRILAGEYPPGQRLLLRPIAEQLQLSVMPIRDALRLLERDGLVTSESHRGATVTPISTSTIIDSISIRMWLEVLAVREAVPVHTDATRALIHSRLEEAEDLTTGDDGLAYAMANRALHEAIEAPAPEPLRTIIAELWERLWQARRRMSLFSLIPDTRTSAQREHRALVAAIDTGDPDEASAVMESHRESTLRAWRAALAGAETAADPSAG